MGADHDELFDELARLGFDVLGVGRFRLGTRGAVHVVLDPPAVKVVDYRTGALARFQHVPAVPILGYIASLGLTPRPG